MFIPYILLLGALAMVRAIAEARYWLTYLQSASPAWIAYVRMAAAKPNAVLNRKVVAKGSSSNAKIAAAKLPGSKK
jgi:hypothetical protein